MTDERGAAAAADEIGGRFGRLDILVNNAGIAGDRAAQGYPVSKAALNMLTVQYAKALAGDGILVNAIAPGACDTDFAKGLPFRLTRTAAEGAAIVVRLATLGRECPTGGFFDDDGKVPW